MTGFEPAYIRLMRSGELAERVRRAWRRKEDCDLVLDESGVARRGLLIRHLVLPEDEANTEKVLAFIAEEISTGTYLNLMDQYRPCYHADEWLSLSRGLTVREYEAVLVLTEKCGLRRLDRPRRIRWSIL